MSFCKELGNFISGLKIQFQIFGTQFLSDREKAVSGYFYQDIFFFFSSFPVSVAKLYSSNCRELTKDPLLPASGVSS